MDFRLMFKYPFRKFTYIFTLFLFSHPFLSFRLLRRLPGRSVQASSCRRRRLWLTVAKIGPNAPAMPLQYPCDIPAMPCNIPSPRYLRHALRSPPRNALAMCFWRLDAPRDAFARPGRRLGGLFQKTRRRRKIRRRRAVLSCDIFVLSCVSGLARCYPSRLVVLSPARGAFPRLAVLSPVVCSLRFAISVPACALAVRPLPAGHYPLP